jgi:hypothetical protein
MGMVLTAPTATKAQPAPFRVSRFIFSLINKPSPMPSATLVPAISAISGIVKLLSRMNPSFKFKGVWDDRVVVSLVGAQLQAVHRM